MNLPVITIVGSPNVGKSTLFNCLTKTRQAIVADYPGLTRDRIYGEAEFNQQRFIVIDTGGISGDKAVFDQQMQIQVDQAIAQADIVLFMLDARSGLTAGEEDIAQRLRRIQQPVVLVMNKIDGIHAEVASSEFFSLGLGDVYPIAAAHARGIQTLMTAVFNQLKLDTDIANTEPELIGTKVAIVGRPNVGKSTLVNRIMGEERVVVYDMPGTTRDSVYIPFKRRDKDYVLIDTAGIRRRQRVDEKIEKFSIVKALQAIESSHVVIMVIDARDNITEQDLRLLGFVINAGRSLVIAINKWDGMDIDEREWVKKEIHRRLGFANFANLHFISALHGTGVGNLFASVNQAYACARKEFSTSQLSELLADAVKKHPPPLHHGRRIKLRLMHSGGHNPPVFVIHGNQIEAVPSSYRRYLINFFREKLKLKGTPIKLEFKQGDNPFSDKKNKLTPRQVAKRKRLMKHVKKK